MVDLLNRDPNNINDHIRVAFEDVLAEPEESHSIDCVWSASSICFNCCKDCTYKLLTLLCGICIAMQWGCEFALIAFNHIWCITPYFKVLEINCGCLKKFYGTCVHCALDPFCESCALIFTAFNKGGSL